MGTGEPGGGIGRGDAAGAHLARGCRPPHPGDACRRGATTSSCPERWCGRSPRAATSRGVRSTATNMVGYVLGWAGVDPEDGLHVHSHMLAALPGRRHAGVGFALKLAQRAMALDQGIQVVRWTFDPLVARNAHFNMSKLGAQCDRFHRNFYGEMGDSLNAGRPQRSAGGAVGSGSRAGPVAVPGRRVDQVVAGSRPGGPASARAPP